MVITQLLHCRILKWDFSINAATFASHLLQENRSYCSREIQMSETKVKHYVEGKVKILCLSEKTHLFFLQRWAVKLSGSKISELQLFNILDFKT